MSSLRDASENAAVLQRIDALTPDAIRLWGKMTLPEMLAHCQKPLQVAAGELQLKRGLIGKLFGKLAKKRFVDDPRPFGKNGPTDPRFVTKGRSSDFERERSTLTSMVQRYGETGAVASEHPFFGPMNPDDWDRLMWKHLDHHLRQFGA